MRALLTLLALLALLSPALAQKPKVLLAPVEVIDGKAFPFWVKAQTQAEIGLAVEQFVALSLHTGGAEMVKALQTDKLMAALKPALKGKPTDAMDALAVVAAEAKVDYVLVLQITRWQQKDRSPGEVLANTQGAHSETKTEFRCWLYDAKSRVLALDGGGKAVEGVFGGGRIGTQKKDELSGDPVAIAGAMEAVNRRRGLYIAKAMWTVIRSKLALAMGLELK